MIKAQQKQPKLSPLNIEAILSYQTRRDGYNTPKQSPELVDAACWNWAINAGKSSAHAQYSVPKIYETIIQYNYFDPNGIYPVAINKIDHLFPNCQAELTYLRKLLPIARDLNIDLKIRQKAQWEFRITMMKIVAISNGFKVVSGRFSSCSKYKINMCTSKWWSWDHWSISITQSEKEVFIQKVPEDDLMHGCDRMWDETYSVSSIGVLNLKPEHIKILQKIPKSPTYKSKYKITSQSRSFNSHWNW